MTDATETLAAAVLAAGPDDLPDLTAHLEQPAPPEGQADDVEYQAGADDLDLISAETFCQQWGDLHDMAGGMVQMRTGKPCPLGDQARSAGGQIAAQAAYSLLSSSPALARLFLSQQSTFFGSLMALGLHGFACVQIVKASQLGEGATA